MEIVVSDLRKAFRERPVLDGVSLTIPAGRVTVILGGSGTGKSVFLKLLMGLIRPDGGSIRLGGQEITGLAERDLLPIRRRVGMIFQQGALLASMRVGDNVALGLIENGLAGRAEAAAIAREKLALVGLAEAFDAWPETLSGGMRKRAAIARALTMGPECILYDEPTAGLDPPRARQVDELIRDVNRREGVTSVVVTHDMDSVRRVADHIFMLHGGRVIFSGDLPQLQDCKDPIVRDFIER